MSEPWQERFWAKVDRRGSDECWEWQGTRHDAYGYGVFHRSDGSTRAHRIAYELTSGPVPDGLLVCHHCDNPPCVNPAHLFLGTSTDNNRDRDAKGRAASTVGELNGSAKLTEADVNRIRELLASGRSDRSIAREYGVGPTQIGRIRTGRLWQHLPPVEADHQEPEAVPENVLRRRARKAQWQREHGLSGWERKKAGRP